MRADERCTRVSRIYDEGRDSLIGLGLVCALDDAMISRGRRWC